MRVYPDTSFVVSWLYPQDSNHTKAAQWFASHQTDDWIISPWTEFETINSLRGLVLARPGPTADSMEARRRYFKHLFQAGPLERESVNWEEALRDANQVSAALSAQYKARAADLLHVAILEQVNPDIFVTFDRDQAVLASRRGFASVHVR